MNRKLLTIIICVGLASLVVLAVVRGGKRLPRVEEPRNTMTVVVDLPKTNAGGAKASPPKPR